MRPYPAWLGRFSAARAMPLGAALRRWSKPGIFLLCLLPLASLLLGDLGANPVERLIHGSGDWALRLLLITLAVTPLRRFSGWSEPLRWRRMLGLFSFFYALLHVTVYAVLEQSLILRLIWADVLERPYISIGFAAFLILLVLAVTSTQGMMRRLGRRWKALHRLVYVAVIGAVVHYLWLVKADLREPLIYLSIAIVLLLARLPAVGGRHQSGVVRRKVS
jgi:sulfoxide reductase heme-binding subunit YedZ